MAHTCPDCGQICYCNGDIDDMCLDLSGKQDKCKHYLRCAEEDDCEEWEDRYD